MDAVIRDMVDTFEMALGPFGDAEVIALAHGLHQAAPEPGALRVLMQCNAHVRFRSRPLLLTVIGDTLALHTPDGPWRRWPLSECAIGGADARLGGQRLSITPPAGETITLSRAIPVDEVPRLLAAAEGAVGESFAAHPPVARLGAAATLYDDRLAFADGPTRPLTGGVRARALEISSAGTTLRSVTRLMQGARGRPRHVLIDGPDWSHLAPAPETAPQLADTFADAINRWAAD